MDPTATFWGLVIETIKRESPLLAGGTIALVVFYQICKMLVTVIGKMNTSRDAQTQTTVDLAQRFADVMAKNAAAIEASTAAIEASVSAVQELRRDFQIDRAANGRQRS